MFQEDCLIVEYLAKICELILQMRYDHQMLAAASSSASSSGISSVPRRNCSDLSVMGILLPKHQYRMINVMTQNWNRHSTSLTLEFFLQRKSDGLSKCAEQWHLSYEKTEGKSSNSLMKLAGLERSIASLLVSTPLWKEYVATDDRKLKNAFILDYKITFSRNSNPTMPANESVL